MICDEYKLNEALGLIVFNKIKLGNIVIEKGQRLEENDLIQLKKYGVEKVFGAIMEETDISFQTALGIIGAKLSGANTAYSIGKDGICRIISTIDGVFMVNDDRVAKFNRLNNQVILNTVNPYIFVNANDVIAEVELTLPIIPQEQIDEIVFRLSGNIDLLSVHDVSNKKAGLIYSRFSDNNEETKHFTSIVKRLVKNFPHMNMDFVNEYETRHTIDDIANTLQRSFKDNVDILFVLTGQRNSCEKDVIVQALNSIVDEVVNLSLPQVGVSDLIIASKKDKKIIVIPYNFDKQETTYLARYITQAIVADKLNSFDFSRPQNYIISNIQKLDVDYKNKIVSAENTELDPKDPHVAAIVLAAGVGARAGRNKLLAEVNGRPLFLSALEAAVKSKASPVFLITGHQAEYLEEYVEDIDVNIIYNPAYRSGIRTSISLGVKSIPSFCDGVIIIPADMPQVSASYIDKMIKSFKKGIGRQLVISNYKEIKHNPIIWGKDVYDFADIVPENADLRPVFIEHADYTTLVEAKNEKEIFDVNYPSDIETLIKAQK